MGAEFSPAEVAARLRAILANPGQRAIEATARRLGISETALRISIDEVDPHPAMEVLVAVIRHHGIDPTWLLSGEYDRVTHRAVIDDDAMLSGNELAALLARQATPGLGTNTVGPDAPPS
jgi:hypothetical protein